MSTNEEKQTGTVADAGKVFHEGKITTYVSGLRYLGKDDLKSTYPYWEGDQWTGPSYHPDIEGYSEEDYKADPEKYVAQVKQLNDDYIQSLKSQGRYLEPYVIRMGMIYNPIFDDPNLTLKGTPPLERYRMIFLDDEDTKQTDDERKQNNPS